MLLNADCPIPPDRSCLRCRGILMQVRAKIYRISSGREAWLDYDKILPILKVTHARTTLRCCALL
jgi:hypothetical protein